MTVLLIIKRRIIQLVNAFISYVPYTVMMADFRNICNIMTMEEKQSFIYYK